MDLAFVPIIPVEGPFACVFPASGRDYLRQGLAGMLTAQPILASRFSPLGNLKLVGALLWQYKRERKLKLQGHLAVVAVEDYCPRENRLFAGGSLIRVRPFGKEVDHRGPTVSTGAFGDLRSCHDRRRYRNI